MEINTRMKKYHHYLTLLSLFMLLGILKLQAAIQLPAIFSNHMVLQRNSELTFWGLGYSGRNNFHRPRMDERRNNQNPSQ